MLKDLVKLANHLDSIGYQKYADVIDNIVKKNSIYFDKKISTASEDSDLKSLAENFVEKYLNNPKVLAYSYGEEGDVWHAIPMFDDYNKDEYSEVNLFDLGESNIKVYISEPVIEDLYDIAEENGYQFYELGKAVYEHRQSISSPDEEFGDDINFDYVIELFWNEILKGVKGLLPEYYEEAMRYLEGDWTAESDAYEEEDFLEMKDRPNFFGTEDSEQYHELDKEHRDKYNLD